MAWLKLMGAEVSGIALDPPTVPNHFSASNIGKDSEDNRQDIRDGSKVASIIKEFGPDYVFHLAAQPLVRLAYDDPVDTWATNVLGTLNVLEALRHYQKKCACVFITSDKCYDNVEWEWGYRETDKLGGVDPYSASKGAAELAIRSHVSSYFSGENNNVRIATGRAGNVIGGGDWAADRIVADCITSWSQGSTVNLRSPNSTRPWQHVLEPLSGYLSLAAQMYDDPKFHGEAFNFGPVSEYNYSVESLVIEMAKHWNKVKWTSSQDHTGPYESRLLKLNCDKALAWLNWKPTLTFEDTVALTTKWYVGYYANSDTQTLTERDILSFVDSAARKGVLWAQ